MKKITTLLLIVLLSPNPAKAQPTQDPLVSDPFQSETIGSGHVLIFAPGNYQALPAAPHHRHAAKRLHERFQQAGFPETNIIRLEGEDASTENFLQALEELTDAAATDDLLMVVLCSYGLQFDHVDYVCAVDTSNDVETESRKSNPRLLSIRSIMEEMALSASMRRLLIIDGSGVPEGHLCDAAKRFGRFSLQTATGQWMILNRSSRLTHRDQSPILSHFMWSLLDGLVEHADGNRNHQVTVLELAAYMKLFAQEENTSTPRFTGKMTSHVPLMATSAGEDPSFPREALNSNAQRLITEAQKMLFYDLDTHSAQGLLDRASRLCHDTQSLATLKELQSTLRILQGEAETIIGTSLRHGKSWTAVLPRESQLRRPGAKDVSKTLPPGSILQLKMHHKGFAWLVSASAAQTDKKEITFVPIEVEPAWIKIKDLAIEPDSSTPGAFLKQRFTTARSPN